MTSLGFVTFVVLIIGFAAAYLIERKDRRAAGLAERARFLVFLAAVLFGICFTFVGPPSEFISGVVLLMLSMNYAALTIFHGGQFSKKITWPLVICTIILDTLAIVVAIRVFF